MLSSSLVCAATVPGMSRRAHTSIPSGLCMHDPAFRAECRCDCDVALGADCVNPQESDVPHRNGRRVHSLLAEGEARVLPATRSCPAPSLCPRLAVLAP